MKNRFLLKLFALAVVVGMAFTTACKDYDDDIKKNTEAISNLKTELAGKIDAVKGEVIAEMNTKINAVNAEITALKGKLETLEKNSATKAELEAAKKEILEKTVLKSVYEAFVAKTEKELTDIKADLAKKATKVELEALKTEITTELGKLQKQLDAMGVRVKQLEDDYAALLAKHDTDVQDLISKIAALKAELDPRITTIETILKIKDNKSEVIDDIYEKLAEQLGLIKANEKAIEALEQDLKDKYEELVAADKALQKQITDNYNELDGRVKWNKDEILKLQKRMTDAEADIKEIKNVIIPALEKKLNNRMLTIYMSLDKRVSSMTFIPDFSSYDGTNQMVVVGLGEWVKNNPKAEVWIQKEKGSFYKGVTVLRYNVSPSNVTLDDFSVVGLLERATEVLVEQRSAENPLLKPMLDQVTLKDGILSVPVLVHSDAYPVKRDWSKNIQVALQVKNKNLKADDEQYNDNDSRLVVSSEYVKANLIETWAAVSRVDEKNPENLGFLLPTSLPKNITLSSYKGANVDLWNGETHDGTAHQPEFTIDLNQYVQAVVDVYGTERLLEKFGFTDHKFVYELINIESEGTEQSNRYVTLNGETGVIGVKPVDGKINSAAVGRTPVVLVKVVHNNKTYAVGYLKITIINKFDNTAVGPFKFTLDDFTVTCAGEYEMTDADVVIADMDQIFNHPRVKLGKDAFFKEYDQKIKVNFVKAPEGANLNMFEFSYAVHENTQSGQKFNYIKAMVANNAPFGKYVIKTTHSSKGYRPDITIEWTFEVLAPEGYALIPNNAFLDNGGIIVNPTIYEQHAKTSTAYEALINNAFMHKNNRFDFTLTPECEGYLTPYFVFTAAPKGYTISKDGLEILGEKNLVAAKIETKTSAQGTQFYVRLNNQDKVAEQVGNYKPWSEAAKGLVGQSVKVEARGYINGANYNWVTLYPEFNVEFVYPVKLVLPKDASVFDQADNGKNVYTLNMYQPNVLQDWKNKVLDVTTADGRKLIDHYEVDYHKMSTGYWTLWGLTWVTTGADWYSPFVFDYNEMKCNIKEDGTIDANNVTYPIPHGMDMKMDQEASEGSTWVGLHGGVQKTVPTKFKFVWKNESTGAVKNAFKVSIPVSVKHKWGTVKENLIITVKPGSGNN